MKTTSLYAIAVCLVTISCGGATSDKSQAQTQSLDEVALEPPAAPPSNSLPKEKAVAPPGMILRNDLKQVLAAGPAALLQEVTTEPVKKDGRFIGFRITQFTRGKPAAIDLCVGDVILKVNGQKIERPENYFLVFQELQVASELRFEVLRKGEEYTLLYPIVD